MIDFSKFELVPIKPIDHLMVQNMARFYTYDISRYLGLELDWKLPEDGLYACFDFKKYWDDAETFSFLIYYYSKVAGFVIIDKKGSDLKVDYNMAQFFILGKFQGKGVGKYIAKLCFDRFQGKWEVMIMPNYKIAYQFWRSIIQEYTDGNFTQYRRVNLHLGHSELRDIFLFST